MKNNYHPLSIILYSSGMLTPEQMNQIPRSTRHYWSKFNHQDYFGHQWAERYIEQFDQIKLVFKSKLMFSGLRLVCQSVEGFQKIIQQAPDHKRLIKKQSQKVIESMEYAIRKADISVSTACKLFRVSRDWYYREKKKVKCQNHPFDRCFKQHPSQLSLRELSVIEQWISKKQHALKTKTNLYYHALRENVFSCAKSTFFKYAEPLSYQRPKRKPNVRKKGFRADKVFEYLHVDVTLIPTLEEGMQKVAFVKDNFSKAILHYKVANSKADSFFITSLFKEAFLKHKLLNTSNPIHIISDGGSENKGELLRWVGSIPCPPAVNKITARTSDFPFSNSMSESIHRCFKTEFTHGQPIFNKADLANKLQEFEQYYMHQKYPSELLGLTPHEVLHGQIPDKNIFTKQIQLAKKKRVEENKNFQGCLALNLC